MTSGEDARGRRGGTPGFFFVAALASLVGCGAPAVTAWPPRLPASATLEPDEPVVLPAAPPPSPSEEPPTEIAAGPDSEPGDGDVVEVTYGEYDGIRYLEVIYGEADSTTPLPTIWVFHGRGDQARVPGGPFWNLAHPVRIFVPEGPVPIDQGFGWFLNRVADDRPDDLAAALLQRSDQLAAMIEAFTNERPTLGRPILTGFSQGGHMTWALALRHPELVDFAFPNAGWIPPSLVPELSDASRFPTIRALHTADDPRVPSGPTLELVSRLRDAGLDAEILVEPSGGHAMSATMDAQLHAWLDERLDALSEPLEPEAPAADAQASDAGLDDGAASRTP
ncbi:MAG: alpha/beta hydrolase [Sandaracinaceae bacterium]